MRKKLFLTLTCVLFLTAITAVIFQSCDKDALETELVPDDEHQISESQAIKFAENIFFSNEPVGRISSKIVESIISIKDEEGINALYIINYENNGFLILSADDRVIPTLGYSENNDFPDDLDVAPPAVNLWIEDILMGIDYVRSNNLEQEPYIKFEWDKLESDGIDLSSVSEGSSRISGDPECQWVGQILSEYYEKPALMSTKWNQTGSFNDAILKWCDDDQAPAGCTAVAIGQIMKYHELPAYYNWAAMPNTYGTAETCILLRDIGNDIGMVYWCSGSWTWPLTKIEDLFEDWGYSSSTTYSSFSHQTVKGEIKGNRPVILIGFKDSFIPTEAHAWVADGVRTLEYYICEENPYTGELWKTFTHSYLWFWMNWGWHGDYDGWFVFNDWTPGDHNYNKWRKMCIVRP